jgi:hypothetical protein
MRMRICAVLCGWIFCVPTAHADSDSGTVVVIPGRPDVPVIVNPYGFDASYAIVEGDFGLNKPAQANAHIVVGGPHLVVVPGPRRYYFPHSEQMPGYGREEVQPPPGRRVTQPPQSYNRSWDAHSDPLPASTDPPYPMTIQPYVGPWGPWRGGERHHPGGRGGEGHHHGGGRR